MSLRRPNFDSYYDPPDPPEYPCDICGKWDEECICPECPDCGSHGDPTCYKLKIEGGHGLARSLEQEASFAAYTKARDNEIAAENAYYDALYEAEQEAKALEADIERENDEYYESIINPNRL